MLELPPKFKSALGNGIRTSLFPVVRFYKDVRLDEPDTWNEAESVNLSIKDTNLDGIAFDPLLLNAPSIQSSADIINNKYTISSVSLSISNASYNGKIFSDDIQSLLNAVCQVYYCANGLDSLDDCLLVYTGTVRRFNQSAESIKLQLEDITEQMLTTKIPSSLVPDEGFYKEKDKGKPYPMVYGYVDKSPLILRSTGFDNMGELENTLSELHIDKKAKLIKGLWKDPNIENYGSDFLVEGHPLIENNYLKNVGTLSIYSNNFIPIAQNLDLEGWVFYVDGITDTDDDDYNPIYSQEELLYDFEQSNGINSTASIKMNANALINEDTIVGIPTRVYRPIDEVECFTYCDNEQDGDSDAINRIYGFTGHELDVTGTWEPWDKSSNITSSLSYERDWGNGGTATWWEPTACNSNINGGQFASTDINWGGSQKFPTERLQNGLTSDGIYLCGINPDGARPPDDDKYKSGGAYIRLILKDNIANFPCSSKVVYDAEYYSFTGMTNSQNGSWPYQASFWTDNRLISLKESDLPESYSTTADDLLLYANELRFPDIPDQWDAWESTNYSGLGDTEGAIRKINGFGEAKTFNNTNEFNSYQFGIPQHPLRGDDSGNDDGYCGVSLFNTYLLQDTIINNVAEQNFYGDIAGRMSDDEVIVSPDKIMEDILRSELNYNGNIELSQNNDWQNSFTLNEQREAKQVFEGLFRSSLVIPSFDSKGQFKFINLDQIIETTEDLPVINNEDVVKYSFELSKIDDIYNQVNVKYNKNYATGDFDKETGYSLIDRNNFEYDTYDIITQTIYPNEPEKQYSLDYYGLKSEETKLDIESEYIRDELTARKLQKRLVSWYANQHLITKIDLSVSYMDLEAGDYIKFDELLGGKLAFGQDYTIYTNKNGQLIYPVFFITKVSKTLQKVSIEAIQVHRGQYGFPDNWEDGIDDGQVEGNSNWNLSDADTIIDDEIEEEELYINLQLTHNDATYQNVQAQVTTNVPPWSFTYPLLIEVRTSTGEGIFFEYNNNQYNIPDGIYDENNQHPDYLILFNGISSGNYGEYGSFTPNMRYDFIKEDYSEELLITYKAQATNADGMKDEKLFFQRAYDENRQLGDINFDGVVNILDAVIMINAIINNTTEMIDDQGLSVVDTADMNDDGVINVLDAVALINIILGE